jgi:hypothetical protein
MYLLEKRQDLKDEYGGKRPDYKPTKPARIVTAKMQLQSSQYSLPSIDYFILKGKFVFFKRCLRQISFPY